MPTIRQYNIYLCPRCKYAKLWGDGKECTAENPAVKIEEIGESLTNPPEDCKDFELGKPKK